MDQLTGNCLIGQSGGPTAVINASLCGAIQQSINSPLIKTVYGAVNGIEGVLNEHIIDLSAYFKSMDELELLKNTPAAFLGSCRYKLPAVEPRNEIYEKIFEMFKKYDIRYFFYIGGNDSMDTVMKLSDYAKSISYPIDIIGIPKTIDNDLQITDHTPGYGSAAKFIATTVLEITKDSEVYDVDSVTIIEIMGRNAGWLTAASALARNDSSDSPDLIYLPEVPFSIENFMNDIKEVQKRKRNVIVCVSEGIKDGSGKYICETISSGLVDVFGHKYLGGTGKVLEDEVRSRLKCKVRSIELNVLQRCAAHIASLTDINEAYEIGKQAVIAAENGATGKMMVFKRLPGEDYNISIESVDIKNIANKEKVIPREWINEKGNNISRELINYMKPLILGEPKLTMKDGLPVYLKLDRKEEQN